MAEFWDADASFSHSLIGVGPLGTTQDDFRREVALLYESRRNTVYGTALRLLKDPAEADDLTQEVFLRLYKHYCAGKTVPHTLNWLITVTRNLALNRLRHLRYETPAPAERPEVPPREQVDSGANPEERFILEQEPLAVAAMLNALPPLERQCIVLFSRGISMREIGASLHIPENQALIKTNLAIKKLKRILSR